MNSFDAVVVGGGPGGATAATLIAKDGHRVLLLEKERFPRYQIGESLLPSTVHGIAPLLGVAGELAAADFPVKRGGTFRWGANPEPWTFTFALSRRLAEPSSTAYQVERQRFDQILLDNARRCGVEVREEHEAVALLRDDDASASDRGRVTGVRFRDSAGRESEVSAGYVVVAAGGASRLSRGIGVRGLSPFFRNVALFGYFEGGKRIPPPNQGNILCAAFGTGWFWYIPLSDTLTSVGAVVARDSADAIQKDPEAAMRDYIEACPLVADLLAGARRVPDGMYAPLRVRKDYSYANSVFWAPGVALVGDAACFVDPVFSTGVHLATYSGLLAARSVNTRLRGGLSDEKVFGEFERRYRREYNLFYEFLQSMYDQNRGESSYFWEARRLLGAPAYGNGADSHGADSHGADSDGADGDRADSASVSDEAAFAGLVAGVLGDGGETIAAPGPVSPAARDLSAELRRASAPGALDEGDIVLTGQNARLLGDALHEATEIQVRAGLGEDASLLPSTPLMPGGLTASPDGLRWTG